MVNRLDLDLGLADVIGDRALHSDARAVAALARRFAAGAKRAGMRTCWLALEGEEEPVGLVEPDYTIRSLGELPAIAGV